MLCLLNSQISVITEELKFVQSMLPKIISKIILLNEKDYGSFWSDGSLKHYGIK